MLYKKWLCWSYQVSYKIRNNEIIEQGYCLYIWNNLRGTRYDYIAANNVLYKIIIIHHIIVVTCTKPYNEYFIRIANSFICIGLVNIRNIYVKYFRCGRTLNCTIKSWILLNETPYCE